MYAMLGALAIGLIISVYTDIRYRLIFNKITLPIALAAPLYWYASGSIGWQDIGMHLLTAGTVFLIFTGLFAVGAMGGGDVKLFTALALWFHWIDVFWLIMVASVLGLFVTIFFVATHKIQKKPGNARIPYGVAIALSGLWTVSQPIFNHFG